MRFFVLDRVEDDTGVSGTGIVAYGAEMPSGRCVLEWRNTPVTLGRQEYPTIGVYDSIQALEAIHGHGGKTRVLWQVEEEQKWLR